MSYHSSTQESPFWKRIPSALLIFAFISAFVPFFAHVWGTNLTTAEVALSSFMITSRTFAASVPISYRQPQQWRVRVVQHNSPVAPFILDTPLSQGINYLTKCNFWATIQCEPDLPTILAVTCQPLNYTTSTTSTSSSSSVSVLRRVAWWGTVILRSSFISLKPETPQYLSGSVITHRRTTQENNMYRRRSVQLFNVQKPGYALLICNGGDFLYQQLRSVSVRCMTLANANPMPRSSRTQARSFTNLVNASARSFGKSPLLVTVVNQVNRLGATCWWCFGRACTCPISYRNLSCNQEIWFSSFQQWRL